MLVLIGLGLFIGLQLVGVTIAQHFDPAWQARQRKAV